MKRTPAALLLLLTGACAYHAESGPRVEPGTLPLPTDPRAGQDEDDLREGRLRWIEEMHLAAPDVDWREIEERNRQAERERRNALRRAGGGHSPFGAQWEEVGSRNQAGHTRCAEIGPDRGGFRYTYIGSANGGVWRGPADGSDWQPMSDAVFGGVDEIVVLEPANLANEDIVLFRQGSSLYRSSDAGATWDLVPGFNGVEELRRTSLLHDGNQTVLVFGRANLGSGSQSVLWASTDLGQTFQVRATWGASWSGDFWTPVFGSGAGTHVYVLQKGSLRLSTDGGFSFSKLGNIDLSASEGALRGSEDGAPHLYAAVRTSSWGVHRSVDGGLNWTDQGNAPDFWGNPRSMVAFSTDADRLFVGGLEGWRSQNAGATWTRVNTWGEYYGDPANKLHADLRGLTMIPDPDALGATDLLFVNTDGGTYVSSDFGESVTNISLEGLGVGQFYSTHTSINDGDLIVGGTQDQGYQRGIREPYTGSGPSTPFDQLISGDYGHLTSSDGDHDYLYSTYPGFLLVQQGELSPSLQIVDFPGGINRLWLPPVVADPLDEQGVFLLANTLWRYAKVGGSWVPTQHSGQVFQLGGSSYLSALAFAPSDPQRSYALGNGGEAWWSTDQGVTWNPASSKGPRSHYFYGSKVVVHPTDSLRAVAGGSGYSSPAVKQTLDGGVTWQPMSPGLPNTLVYDITYALDGTDDLYAATEAGAFRWDAASGVWVNIMGLAAPATTYWSVEAIPQQGAIRFGTYGRGIWDYVYDPDLKIVFGDGFESGDYLDGGWVLKNKRPKVKGMGAYTGSFGAHLKRVTWIERSVSTVGYNQITLEFAHRSQNYETGEKLYAEWWDGTSWQTEGALGSADWKLKSYVLPPAAGNNPEFKIRFRTTAKGNNSVTGKRKRSHVDDVRLLGS